MAEPDTTQQDLELSQKKWKKRLGRITEILFAATLTFSSILWAFVIKVGEKIPSAFFSIFAGFSMANAAVAVGNAVTSTDEKFTKWMDGLSATAQAGLITTGVLGALGMVALSIVTVHILFLTAISMWILHDLYKTVKNLLQYLALRRHGLKDSEEAKAHWQAFKTHGLSLIVAVASLLAMGAFMGAMAALAGNPVTGPIVLAFSALMASILIYKIIARTAFGKWVGKTWNNSRLGQFVKRNYKRAANSQFVQYIAQSKVGRGIRWVGTAINNKLDAFVDIVPGLHPRTIVLETIPAHEVPEGQEPPEKAAPPTPKQREILQAISPFYAARRADVVATKTVAEGFAYLQEEITAKCTELTAKINTPAGFGALFKPDNLELNKRSFLEQVEFYLKCANDPNTASLSKTYSAYLEKGLTAGFTWFLEVANKTHHTQSYNRAYVGRSDVDDICEAAKKWLEMKEQALRSAAVVVAPATPSP